MHKSEHLFPPKGNCDIKVIVVERKHRITSVGTPVPAERQLRRFELVALMFPNQKAVVRLDFTFGISS